MAAQKHSSRVRANHLPTVLVSVATTRYQYRRSGVGPQVNKFEQVFSDDHQMSVVEREVGNYSTMDNSHMVAPLGQTDACENITFPQLRLRAVTKNRQLFNSVSVAALC